MPIETILVDPATSLLVMTSGRVKEIVIGVSHHAPLGVIEISSGSLERNFGSKELAARLKKLIQ